MAAKCVHIVNLASVRELERVVGPAGRTRCASAPTSIIEGLQPWAEFGWLGKELQLGAVRLAVFERTERCAATNVDPATGARDMAIPAALQRAWGHTDFGIYARVIAGGDDRRRRRRHRA